MINLMVKCFIKLPKKKLWAEMLVNMEDMGDMEDMGEMEDMVVLNNVKGDAHPWPLRVPFVTGTVQANNWLLNCFWFYQ